MTDYTDPELHDRLARQSVGIFPADWTHDDRLQASIAVCLALDELREEDGPELLAVGTPTLVELPASQWVNPAHVVAVIAQRADVHVDLSNGHSVIVRNTTHREVAALLNGGAS